MAPQGVSVVLNAPAVCGVRAQADSKRHLEAAATLGADVEGVPLEEASEAITDTIKGLMRRLNVPNGLDALGETDGDIPNCLGSTLPQHRVTERSPYAFGDEDTGAMFEDAMNGF